jgi:hypothetical protein
MEEQEDFSENEVDYEAVSDNEEEKEEEEPFKVVLLEAEQETSIVYIIPEDNHITSDALTTAECVQVINTRISLIDNGSPIYVDITGLSDSRSIALSELYQKKIPLCVDRYVISNKIERKVVNKMVIPFKFQQDNPV